MGFLFAKGKQKEIPQFTGLQVQTAVNVLPIPIIYGGPRIQMNLIYVNGFRAVPQQASGGGKGLLTGGKGETSGYKYYATFIGALGEGELSNIRVVFDNQATYAPNNAPIGKVFEFITGTESQAPWAPITASWPEDAFGYRDTAYIGFYDWPLDSSATVPQLNFVVDGLLHNTCPLNRYTAPDATSWLLDADPGLVIWDFLTNETHGVLFPQSYIDDLTIFTQAGGLIPGTGDAALSTYCQAVGFGFSVVLNNFEPASSILERWCRNIGVAPVWTGAILKFIPYWDSYSDQNPNYDEIQTDIPRKYFRPNLTPIFDFNDSHFIQSDEDEDPITVARVDIAAVKNVVRVDFRDRYLLFNNNVSEAKDENMVETYGLRVERMGVADEFSLSNYSMLSAQIQLKRNISVRNNYKFRLGLQYCVLDPMDIVTISDSTLGLSLLPVRIKSIEEDEEGILTIVAEEFQIGSATATLYPSQVSEPPTVLDTNEAPASVNPPIILEPTPGLLAVRGQAFPTIVIGVSGGSGGVSDPNWGGASIYVSNDDITYSSMGSVTQPSRMGELTVALAAYSGANPDNTNTLTVSLIESNGLLESVTSAQAEAGLTVCAVVDLNGDMEFIGYTTATLIGQNTYQLTGLYRGLYGSISCSHADGSRFLRVDTAVFEAVLPTEFIGVPLWTKLTSFNIFGQAAEELADVTAYTFTPNGMGINLNTNAIILALQAGISVDLNAASVPLDLNIGGGAACAPVSVTVDLGVG